MKFIDEAKIEVKAGKGGEGCLSFHRARHVPLGGPDGGDGGDGGDVLLVVDPRLNTLIDFRYKRKFAARNGQPGMGQNRIGKSAEDLRLSVPPGTLVYDNNTDELIGDITLENPELLVAKGGFHGLGNARFKSSINRSPRKTTKGTLGDERELRLELRLLADVGLLGLPNAGKSTFIRQVSAARPKVADYPFTTLKPVLGVVSVDIDSSFVIADIPGIIEGAADGAGLGLQFLRHVERTELLLHVIDVGAERIGESAKAAFETISKELELFSEDLANKTRWVVLNKLDQFPEDERDEKVAELKTDLDWDGPLFAISAATGMGCDTLTNAIGAHLAEKIALEEEQQEREQRQQEKAAQTIALNRVDDVTDG